MQQNAQSNQIQTTTHDKPSTKKTSKDGKIIYVLVIFFL